MRMRLKKHLDERIADCGALLLAREGDYFYTLTEEQRQSLRLNPAEIFGNEHPIVLELGCGKGAWILQMAERHPELNFIAVEKLSNVIVVACEQAQRSELKNVRFLNVRAENLGWWLPNNCISRIALNFSCPFPKKTYANRRLTSKNYLQLYKKLLKSVGYISQKTDNRDFFEWSIESLVEQGYEVYDVCYDLPVSADDPVTEYESKFRAQGAPICALKAKPQNA